MFRGIGGQSVKSDILDFRGFIAQLSPHRIHTEKEPVIYNIIIFIILFLCKKTVQFKGIIDSNMKYLEIISEQNELRIREHGKEKMV